MGILVLAFVVSSFFIYVFLVCSSTDQWVKLIWAQLSPLLMRLVLSPALVAGSTIWIVRTQGHKQAAPSEEEEHNSAVGNAHAVPEDTMPKVEADVERNVDASLSRDRDGYLAADRGRKPVSDREDFAIAEKAAPRGKDIAARRIQKHLKERRCQKTGGGQEAEKKLAS